jgi:crotonobetainyl-CoA:carnitine CoA-transferase CaiB-like acyl-CoA transferase
MLAPSTLGMHLADLGAEVIKVEDPDLGDYVRDIGRAPAEEASRLHRHWNRGKRSLTLDLRKSAGATVFEELVGRSDIVIEGLRPGSLERRGVGYARLREIKPNLVFVSISGFGQHGPYRDVASHGPAFEAFAGLADPTRSEDGLPRVPLGKGGVGIQAAPLLGALGTLAALIRARSTGEGCYLDVAESDGATYWNALNLDDAADDRFRTQRKMPYRGPRFQLPDGVSDLFEQGARCQYYQTADDRYLIFMALERKFFENFANAIDRPDLLQMSRSTREFDHEYGNTELRKALTEVFLSRTLAEWMHLFERSDVPGIPVNIGEQVLDDPHFKARTRWLDPDVHGIPMMAAPIHTQPPLPLPRPAPRLGEHTVEVLREVLEYDNERIRRLADAGLFGSAQG